jgi:ADP-ribose pyrophosphatase
VEEFFAVSQADYVNVFALTPQGLTPIVRQFRPAVETYTWELPAGTRDTGETARAAAIRELSEETGLSMLEMVKLGETYVDTARLSNRFHSFAAIAEPTRHGASERGVETRLVSAAKLRTMIERNELSLQTHVGLVFRAMTHPASVRMLARHGLGGVPRQFLG